jgi:hypothetical protein
MAVGIHNSRTLRCGVILLGALLSLSLRAAETRESEALTTALAVRNLSVTEAQKQLPVRLTGVVTFFDETLFSRFIQDNTAGIYIRDWPDMALSPARPMGRGGGHHESGGICSGGSAPRSARSG